MEVEFEPVEANLRDSFRLLASCRPSGEVRETPGVSIACAGVTFQMFNAAFLSTPVPSDTELKRRVASASVFFSARGCEWSYWICLGLLEGKLPGAARGVLRKYGLNLASELPGMIADRLLPPSRPLPQLEIRRVGDAATQDAFCDIGSACFNVPKPWFREVFEVPALWRDLAGYVGYLEGRPVSTAAIIPCEGVIGVYNVATLPEMRHRGCAEVLMRHAVEEARARTGFERSVLQSTALGRRMYERMGYQVVTRFEVYSS